MHDIHHCYDPRDGVSEHRALNHIPNTFNLPWKKLSSTDSKAILSIAHIVFATFECIFDNFIKHSTTKVDGMVRGRARMTSDLWVGW